MERTTTTTAVFLHPFMLDDAEGTFPAGTYVVETDEELISGLSFTAYRRIRTTITVPVGRGIHPAMQALTIDPKGLEKALELDAASAADA